MAFDSVTSDNTGNVEIGITTAAWGTTTTTGALVFTPSKALWAPADLAVGGSVAPLPFACRQAGHGTGGELGNGASWEVVLNELHLGWAGGVALRCPDCGICHSRFLGSLFDGARTQLLCECHNERWHVLRLTADYVKLACAGCGRLFVHGMLAEPKPLVPVRGPRRISRQRDIRL